MAWLQKPNPYLGNQTPLQTAFGGEPKELRIIEELLFALENGIHV